MGDFAQLALKLFETCPGPLVFFVCQRRPGFRRQQHQFGLGGHDMGSIESCRITAHQGQGIRQGSVRTGGEIGGKQDVLEGNPLTCFDCMHKAPPQKRFWRRRLHRVGCHLPGDGQVMEQAPFNTTTSEFRRSSEILIARNRQRVAFSAVRLTHLHARFKSLLDRKRVRHHA